MAKKKDEPERRKRDFSYTQNREVSWLHFDARVLDEALDDDVPLFERMKYCAIFQSNLDEWFMIRVGGLDDLTLLKRQPTDNKSNETPAQQLDVLMRTLPALYRRQESAYLDLERRIAGEGLERVEPDAYTEEDLARVGEYFDRELAPIISPLVVDPRHPFPNLRNGVLYVVCSLEGTDEDDILGMVEVPPTVGRVVALPSRGGTVRFTLVEDVVTAKLGECFGRYVPTDSSVARVTRNADIEPDGDGALEEADFLQHMKKVLRRRTRLQPVRLEVKGNLDERLVTFVRKDLELDRTRVFRLKTPPDLSYVYQLEDLLPAARKAQLTYPPFEPQPSPMVDASRPMREQVEDHDVLLFYPYESMDPLLRLIHEAANDDACISIRITLYRVAKRSRLCESLITAAEMGKDVTVLMELRARFDEENNMEWADRLDSAGCTVIYGSEGFKCHSKICQITYHDAGGFRRITCLGTGNFNEKTARLYSDFMLMTAHPGIAEDGNVFFRNLTLGNLRGSYRYLGVAPAGLKPLVMRGIDREIDKARAGEPAQVFMKMNSLTDRDVIDKLAAASQAGVKVLLIIRGICCLLPCVEGKTSGIKVRQIVGRLLEHARVYAFGVEADTIYLSSADMMTRNTERRVEIAYPVLDPVCRDMVVQYMDVQLADNVKASKLRADGTWQRLEPADGERPVDSQAALIALAYQRAQLAKGESVQAGTLAPAALRGLPEQAVRALQRRHGATGLPMSLLRDAPEPPAEAAPEHEMPSAPKSERHRVAIAQASELPAKVSPDPAYAPELASVDAELEATEAVAVATKPEASAAAPTARQEPAPSAEAASKPVPQPEPAPAAAPERAAHVQARIIEPEPQPARQMPKPAEPQVAREAAEVLARRSPGRLSTALSLFGLGIKTLLRGTGKRR